jgi:alkylation response protein AidB-like acyl-CoA dehydrogenase
MDHEFSESQELLRRSAADFFAREYPLERMRELRGAAEEERKLWKAITGLGWTGAPFPEEVGGFAGSFMDAAVLLEEMGWAGCASPYVHSAVAVGVGLQGRDGELARRLAAAEVTAVFAPSTPAAPSPSVDGAGLAGSALGVPWPEEATLVVAPLAPGNVAAVEGAAGRRLASSGSEPVGAVDFGGARVVAEYPAVAAHDIMVTGAAGAAVLLVGASRRALDVAVSYAKERIQFGRPIGSFQAIQHKCANMLIDLEVGRSLAYKAASLHGEGFAFERSARYAKAYAGEMAQRVTREAIQIHGGVGFVDNHKVQLFYKMALTGSSQYGTAHEHRSAIADLVLAGQRA